MNASHQNNRSVNTVYLDHYGLKSKPFQISTDPEFLWLGKKHKEALTLLKFGLAENRTPLVLTGDIGTGKTTLVHALIKNLDDDVITVKIADPCLECLDFYNFIARAFKMNRRFDSREAFLLHLGHFCHTIRNSGQRLLLIIDEAQRISQTLLEDILLPSNIENQISEQINIFFVGQNEFNDLLMAPENTRLRKRIRVRHQIEPLTEKETDDYIRHRLKVAGTQQNIFTPSAVREIFAFSEGHPRLINIVCDLSLLKGFLRKTQTIEADTIKQCAAKLHLPNQNSGKTATCRTTPPVIKPESEPSETVSGNLPASSVSGPQKRIFIAVLALILMSSAGGLIYHARKTTNKAADSLPAAAVPETKEQELKSQPLERNTESSDAAIVSAPQTPAPATTFDTLENTPAPGPRTTEMAQTAAEDHINEKEPASSETPPMPPDSTESETARGNDDPDPTEIIDWLINKEAGTTD